MTYQNATKAIILARVSTEEQAEKGHYSIPAQLRKQKEYIKSGGRFNTLKEVIAELLIEGESAFKGKRNQFRKALEIVKRYNEPIAIIFDLVDRFSRRFDELLEFDKLREEGKVELHFINQGWKGLVIYRNSTQNELSDWEDEVASARKFSRRISSNVRRSIREKLQRGEYPGGDLPTGYKAVMTVTDGNRITKKKELDEERANFVMRCFRLFITDKYSAHMLAEKLAKAGFTSKSRNGKLPKSVKAADVLNILNNPFYFGKFYYRDPDTGDRALWPKNGRAKNYPILIEDWKLFEKAQEILKKHNSRADGHKEHDSVFKGLLKCGFCDHTLTPEEMSRCYKDKDSEKAKEAIYYHCNNGRMHHDPRWYEKKFGTDHSGVYKARKGSKREGETIVKCPQRWWKEKKIEEWILNELESVTYGEEVYDWFRSALEGEYEQEFEVLEDQIKSARSEYTGNEEIVRGLIRSMATEKDVELKEAFRSEYQELKKKQTTLKEEIGDLESARDINTDSAVETLRYCSNLKDQYLNLDDEGKHDFLKIVFSKIELQRGEFRLNKGKGRKVKADIVYFTWNEPFATLLSVNVQELADQWEEGRGKNIRLTKKKKTEASLFP